MKDFKTKLGLYADATDSENSEQALIEYANLKLASLGQPVYGEHSNSEFYDLSKSLIVSYQEKSRLLTDYLPAL